MKRSVLTLLLVTFCQCLAAAADENVRAAQAQLRLQGFYFGDTDGVYNDQTAAAVTRYQIRHGLQITGQLDAPTAKALGTRPLPPAPAGSPPSMSGTWRRLRNGEQQFVPAEPQSSPDITSSAQGKPSNRKRRAAPPPPSETPEPFAREDYNKSAFSRERLRDYIGAFVLAGIDPKVGAELEFFADRADYFGDGKLSREKIRRDLLRYDARWPERRFWLAGDLEVRSESNRRLRVAFPLRYELRNGSKRASGTVRKTLVLEKTANNDFEIAAVNEKKIR
jgi:hypothetical protein